MYNGNKIIDCHVHYSLPITIDEINNCLDKEEADFGNLVLVPDRKRVSANPDALMIKHLSNYRYYTFINLDVSYYFRHKKDLGKSFEKYIKELVKCGADGVKIIEGKPALRKSLPIPKFDSEVFDPFFKYMEENNLPILWHVNDPEEFWDKDNIPYWAKKNGWFYDESYINNEVQYTEILNILKKHPNIKIIFAHFFFMSNQLERLSKILDEYKNVCVDLTPGIEMYVNLSKDINKTKEFFIKYQDRIMYGTDIGARVVLKQKDVLDTEEGVLRSNIIKDFISTDKSYVVKSDGNFLKEYPEFTLNGLNLNKDIQKKIYFDNFYNYVGGKPRKVNSKKVIKLANSIKTTIKIMSLFDKNIVKDFRYLNMVIDYFKKNK